MDAKHDLLPKLRVAAATALERATADLALVFAMTGDADDWALSVRCERLLSGAWRQAATPPTDAEVSRDREAGPPSGPGIPT